MKIENEEIKIFAFGDPHLSFGEEKPMDIFGEEWKAHEKKIEKAWREKIGQEDYVLIVGDISWALKLDDAKIDLEWIDNLPGKKIIIKGNHDLWWHGIKNLNNLYDTIYFLQNDHVMVSDALAICGTRGWLLPDEDGYTENDAKITNRERMRLKFSLDSAMNAGAKKIICGMHFPPAINPIKNTDFTTLISEYPVEQVVYGHLHGSAAYKKGIAGTYKDVEYKLVSIDYLDFKPLLIANCKIKA